MPINSGGLGVNEKAGPLLSLLSLFFINWKEQIKKLDLWRKISGQYTATQ